ncbi:hypothetical protein IP97_00985 [Flavobacterium cheniae]|uniref:Uncharacterized protein n=2 Tax=Flavobacterium cheniae TaxID=295428 RepID=A0A562KM52_9FLAO|nr:hypothetical protein C8D80_1361 [Flavobacterium cheniae]TWH96444.1 hypothetical protein IP97_00985 [Flavobacterium cheniae]
MIIIELIFGFLIEVLFEIPGAFFRWLYFGRKESFSNFIKRNSIYNYIISFLFIITSGFTIAYLNNSKSVENCILDMKFQRENENPGPDLITFKISSNDIVFENNKEKYGLVEVIIDYKKSFKTMMFEISKIGEKQYELNVSSPYFTYKTHYSEEQVYSFFNNKGFTIFITLDGKKFVFVKC